MFITHRHVLAMAVVSGIILFNSTALQAAEDSRTIRQQLLELRQQMQRLQQTYEQQINALEQRLDGLESKSDKNAPVAAAPAISSPYAAAATNSGFQIGLSGLFAAGSSSVDNDALEGVQGGAHDPSQNGFTVQNVELSIAGTVDPYFDAQANIIFQIDADRGYLHILAQ